MSRSVDRKALEILNALASAPVFKKQGQVRARRAVPGEVIETVLGSGVMETVNTASEDEWVVTNPGGEQYIIKDKKFQSRYEPTATEGVYSAKGHCRAIVNPFGEPIEILASWGELQNGDGACMIADVCDAAGSTDNEPYIIAADAFSQTYAQV